jgi:alpha-N-arabinofuranosidase
MEQDDHPVRLVRNNPISRCGQAGIVGSMGAAFSTFSGNEIHEIQVRKRFAGAEIAGIKFHGAVDTILSGNHIHHNDGEF